MRKKVGLQEAPWPGLAIDEVALCHLRRRRLREKMIGFVVY